MKRTDFKYYVRERKKLLRHGTLPAAGPFRPPFDAYAVVFDLVRFSEKSADEQWGAVTKLRRIVLEVIQPLGGQDRASKQQLWHAPAGDGGVLVFSTDSGGGAGAWLFARELVRHCREQRVEIRLGLAGDPAVVIAGELPVGPSIMRADELCGHPPTWGWCVDSAFWKERRPAERKDWVATPLPADAAALLIHPPGEEPPPPPVTLPQTPQLSNCFLSHKSKDNPRKNDNPFHPVGTMPCGHHSYVRRAADAELERLLNGPGQLISIVGESGIGKSSLVEQARRILPNHRFISGGLADLRSEDAERFMKNFFRFFLEMDDWPDLDNYAGLTPCVLCLDDLGHIRKPGFQAFFPGLVERFSRDGAALRVLATFPVKLVDILQKAEVKESYADAWKNILLVPFREAEARQLFERLLPRSRQLVDSLFTEVRKNSLLKPKLLQCLCHRLYDSECDRTSDAIITALIQDPASYK